MNIYIYIHIYIYIYIGRVQGREADPKATRREGLCWLQRAARRLAHMIQSRPD